jgi:probable HAF family extracellular repeat protein
MRLRTNYLSVGLLSAAFGATLISFGCGSGKTPVEEPTPTPTPLPLATPTPKPGDPTPTPSPTPTPVSTPSPTPTPVPTPTPTPTPKPSEFVVTDLGVLSGNTKSIAFDINNNGIVIGFSYDGSDEPEDSNGTPWFSNNGSVIQPFASYLGIPLAINDAGNICGSAYFNNDFRPVYYASTSAFPDPLLITFSNGNINANPGYGYGISLSGGVVGINDAQSDAVYWENSSAHPPASNQITTFTTSVARSINASGVIVGAARNSGSQNRAMIWRPNGATYSQETIASPTSAPGAVAYSINRAGEVVGYTGTRAFYYNSGTMTALDYLGTGNQAQHNDEPGDEEYDYRHDAALDINDNGWIVGDSMVGNGSWRACIWRKDAGGTYRVTNLNSLISSGSGWVLYSAKAVNNRGQIVGYGSYAGSTRRAFLLTPR